MKWVRGRVGDRWELRVNYACHPFTAKPFVCPAAAAVVASRRLDTIACSDQCSGLLPYVLLFMFSLCSRTEIDRTERKSGMGRVYGSNAMTSPPAKCVYD